MASKSMTNAAFKARLILRPSHQRTSLFGTVNRLECPNPLPILSSRSYADSTSTPPFPKSSGSTEDSRSSRPENENWFSSKGWGKVWSKVRSKVWTGALTVALATVGIVCAGSLLYVFKTYSLLKGLTTHATQSIWGDWHQTFRRHVRELARESAIYNKLKSGPVFQEKIKYPIPREPLVEKIRELTTPAEETSLYPIIIGEHGTGKTSLIKLAVNGMGKPKGVVYVDIPRRCNFEADVVKAMQKALDWNLDQPIDSSESISVEDVLEVFSRVALKYKLEYERVPVLIIDNANRLAQKHQGLLDLFQDYAKDSADDGSAAVVFVSSEGRMPSDMRKRSAWSRKGETIEIGDVSKEEALQYLKLRNIDGERAAQIYELVGGRMIHLKFIADRLGKNSTFEGLRQTMFSDAGGQLKAAEILPRYRYHKEGAAIVRELLRQGSISQSTFDELVDPEIGERLLETNIFAVHLNAQEITFQSTVMKRLCEQNSALWTKPPVLGWSQEKLSGLFCVGRREATLDGA